MGKRNLKWDRMITEKTPLVNDPPYNWRVTLDCGHECKLQLGDYPVPGTMRCTPCRKEEAALAKKGVGW